MKEHKEELILVLREKVEEGIKELKTMSILDKEYSSLVVSVLNSNIEAQNLQQQIDFDKTQEEREEN